MHFYTMTILEETESECRSELKLWENAKGHIWMQIGYGEDDPCTTQGIPLTADDARALIGELTRLVKEIEPTDKSYKTLTPSSHEPNVGQLPIPSKVNWK